jgi:AcrR family transcriptional regulator
MPRRAGKARRTKDPIDAALALAAEQAWGTITLGAIAKRAGLPLAELIERFPSKTAILVAFSRRIDGAMLKAHDLALAGEPAHDRLFDVVMKRLDALAPHRPALRSIVRGAPCDVEAVCAGACALRRSLTLMLEAAGLSSSGLLGAVRRKGLALIYLDTLRVWLNDDSDGFDHTMTRLNGHLQRTARFIEALRGAAAGRARGAET